MHFQSPSMEGKQVQTKKKYQQASVALTSVFSLHRSQFYLFFTDFHERSLTWTSSNSFFFSLSLSLSQKTEETQRHAAGVAEFHTVAEFQMTSGLSLSLSLSLSGDVTGHVGWWMEQMDHRRSGFFLFFSFGWVWFFLFFLFTLWTNSVGSMTALTTSRTNVSERILRL